MIKFLKSLLLLLIFATAKLQAVECEKFILFCPPKCGTHLLAKAMELILEKKAQYQLCDLPPPHAMLQYTENVSQNDGFVVAHNWTRPTLMLHIAHGYKVIFIIRDPRDQLLSIQKWFKEGQWSWLGASRVKPDECQIYEMITGAQFGWRAYDELGWRLAVFNTLPPASSYLTRFEYLVGEAGEGSRDLQLLELINLAAFLDVELSPEEAERIAEQLFGGTGTFRSGRAGQWKKVFTPHQKFFYNLFYANQLKTLGYEL